MLAIAGGKGGCGKTTTAVGLAAALAEQRRRPLVVDVDVDMPNLDLLADVPVEPGLDHVAGGGALRAATHDSARFPGVSVVPATPGADAREALDRLPATGADEHRPVLLDCPGGAGPPAAVPLRAADRALVVTTTDPASVADARKTVDVARSLGARVVGCAVIGTADVPAAIARRLDVPARPVPACPSSPLADPGVRAAYGRLAGELRAE